MDGFQVQHMIKFDINKPPKKYKFMVYCKEICGDRCANGIEYKYLYIKPTVKKPDDFCIKECMCESDTEEHARIVKVFDTNREAEEYISKMENLKKCDWQKYLDTLWCDRRAFLMKQIEILTASLKSINSLVEILTETEKE